MDNDAGGGHDAGLEAFDDEEVKRRLRELQALLRKRTSPSDEAEAGPAEPLRLLEGSQLIETLGRELGSQLMGSESFRNFFYHDEATPEEQQQHLEGILPVVARVLAKFPPPETADDRQEYTLKIRLLLYDALEQIQTYFPSYVDNRTQQFIKSAEAAESNIQRWERRAYEKAKSDNVAIEEALNALEGLLGPPTNILRASPDIESWEFGQSPLTASQIEEAKQVYPHFLAQQQGNNRIVGMMLGVELAQDRAEIEMLRMYERFFSGDLVLSDYAMVASFKDQLFTLGEPDDEANDEQYRQAQEIIDGWVEDLIKCQFFIVLEKAVDMLKGNPAYLALASQLQSWELPEITPAQLLPHYRSLHIARSRLGDK